MPMRVTDNESIQTAMRGFCRVCVNVVDFSPDAVVETINGVSTGNGRLIGGLVGEPSFASEDELIDYTENIYGAQGPFRGGWNVQSTQSSITATIMKMSVDNFGLLFPDFADGGVWGDANATAASLTIGTGAAGVIYTAQSGGTSGNDIRVAHVDPGAAGSLSVAVSGNDITVTLASDGTAATSTASEVADAANASSGALALVAATLDGDGTGTAVTQALTNLSGGSGTSYGQIVTRSGNVRDENYLDNALLVFEGQTDDEVGMMIRVNNAINRADSKEFSPDGDGNIAGVEVQLMGHQDLGSLSDTGQPQPPVQFYIPSYAASV